MAVEDLAAGVVEAHERAAHRGALEHEARERVGERRVRGMRGALVSDSSATV